MLRHWGYKSVFIFGLCVFGVGALMMLAISNESLLDKRQRSNSIPGGPQAFIALSAASVALPSSVAAASDLSKRQRTRISQSVVHLDTLKSGSILLKHSTPLGLSLVLCLAHTSCM